jgi:glycerol-3-phosphate cytidylyltransferase-like family protein
LSVFPRIASAIIKNQYTQCTFFEESLELKKWYILEHKADALVMGDDWKGRFDELSEVCEVIYLPRTPNISSTEIKITVTERA